MLKNIILKFSNFFDCTKWYLLGLIISFWIFGDVLTTFIGFITSGSMSSEVNLLVKHIVSEYGFGGLLMVKLLVVPLILCFYKTKNNFLKAYGCIVLMFGSASGIVITFINLISVFIILSH